MRLTHGDVQQVARFTQILKEHNIFSICYGVQFNTVQPAARDDSRRAHSLALNVSAFPQFTAI